MEDMCQGCGKELHGSAPGTPVDDGEASRAGKLCPECTEAEDLGRIELAYRDKNRVFRD